MIIGMLMVVWYVIVIVVVDGYSYVMSIGIPIGSIVLNVLVLVLGFVALLALVLAWLWV